MTLDPRNRDAWNVAVAVPSISAARDLHKPFQSLPRELAGSTLLQPSHGDRHRALLATGRVWKTRVVSTSKPSQIAIAFGADPTRELVWTWTTVAKRRHNPPSNLPASALIRVVSGWSNQARWGRNASG